MMTGNNLRLDQTVADYAVESFSKTHPQIAMNLAQGNDLRKIVKCLATVCVCRGCFT
jgi:hypothetical protein